MLTATNTGNSAHCEPSNSASDAPTCMPRTSRRPSSQHDHDVNGNRVQDIWTLRGVAYARAFKAWQTSAGPDTSLQDQLRQAGLSRDSERRFMKQVRDLGLSCIASLIGIREALSRDWGASQKGSWWSATDAS